MLVRVLLHAAGIGVALWAAAAGKVGPRVAYGEDAVTRRGCQPGTAGLLTATVYTPSHLLPAPYY